LNIKNAKINLAKIAMAGIDIAKVTDALEIDGIAKFEASWLDLMSSVKSVISGS
jgi:transaldolase